MGGIYTLGVSPGTRLRYNVIHDVNARAYGGWGIYPDEGSSEIVIENNLVYRCQDGALFCAPQPQHHRREQHLRLQPQRPNRAWRHWRVRADLPAQPHLLHAREGRGGLW